MAETQRPSDPQQSDECITYQLRGVLTCALLLLERLASSRASLTRSFSAQDVVDAESGAAELLAWLID